MDKNMAIVGLIVNLLVPGLGTLIAGMNDGYKKTGIIQLILTIVGYILTIVLIGPLFVLASWIWALITSIQMIQKA